MDVHIEFEPGGGRRDEIYRQLRAAILDGRLRAGDPLPPTRELAKRVEVSRNTVSAAYDRLTAEGFLEARVGSGTFVRDGAGRAVRPEPSARSPLRPVEIWDAMPDAPRSFVTTAEFDFRAGVPDLRRFPFDTWRRLVANQLRESAADVLTYGDPQGHPKLRAAIARQIGLSRGVRAEPDDVLVTGGAQQAIDLIARILLRPGEHAAVEDPGYPPPRLLFQTLGARVHAVPVDDEGLVVDAIPAGCRLVYVTPSHQYPFGTAMSLRRRLALLDWAERHDAAIIEDDYDTEFRYAGRPLEPLHSLDSSNRVLYIGSFSKVLAPGLRLGFLVAPPSLRVALTKAKSLTDWQTSNPIQAALAQFMDEGGFARHVRASRREYEARHALVGRVLARDFAGLLTPIPSSAGLHVSAFASTDMRPIVKAARKAGIRLYSLEGFTARKEEVHGLVFGYGAIPLDRIEPGLRRLRGLMGEP
ncbi:PLP-dependent aminotransferase family protein [Amycolatopsis sp. cg5]|uniref:MocR-like pyridoxine biosynthesis transcription factor PdxR n=1 Tax=Amycolatopsis sp. cg5 TaxID=3238802 RepID=UPI0035257AF3